MATGGPPDTLSERDILIAHMIAAGVPARRIAETFGVHENRVSIIRGSPQFRALVPQIQREITEQIRTDVSQRLAAEAMPTLTRLCTLRDQEDHLPTALGAANALFDRQVPRVTVADVRNEHVIRFDGAFLRGVEGVLREMGEAIDVTPPTRAQATMPRGAMLASVPDD